jgi:hypothetical protein
MRKPLPAFNFAIPQHFSMPVPKFHQPGKWLDAVYDVRFRRQPMRKEYPRHAAAFSPWSLIFSLFSNRQFMQPPVRSEVKFSR